MMKFINTRNFYLLKTIIVFFLGNTSFAQENSIVIMFKNHSPVEKENTGKYPFFTYIPEILYWDNQKGVDITPIKTDETTVITTQSSTVLLRSRYNVLSYCDFIFSSGDSVVINYVDGFPYPKVINRVTKEYDFKVDFEIRKRLIPKKFDPINIYNMAAAFTDYDNISVFKGETSNSIQQFLNDQKMLLDSLYHLGKISEIVYDFHKNRISWLKASNELQQNKLTQTAAANLIQEKSNERFPNRYRNEFVDLYIRKFYNDGSLDSKNSLSNYTRIKNDKLFDEQQRNRLLGKITRIIITNSSNADAKSHFEKFKRDINDPVLVERIYNQFKLKLSNSDNNFDVYRSEDLTPTKFENLIKKRKYSYIDFWASWCAPCIKEMPSSKVLSEKYSDEKIGFVYISIDDDEKAWEEQANKLNLDKTNSFLIIDTNDSKIIKNFSIDKIPRYIIVNDKGKVINSNAPRPSDPKIYEVLDKLFKE